VSARQQQRVLNYVKIGLEEDKARLVAGGSVPPDPTLKDGFYVEPTVFADVTANMRIFQEEVFGPFVSITRFSTEEEGLALANDSPFGLAGAIRTSNVTRAHRVASQLRCGIVWINDHHRLDPASPWGGVKDSGLGRECGTESFDQHFETKSVMVRLSDAKFDWYTATANQPRLN
jgi:acyl-CoA reductase-like NAD-dependent aldehyde dehydrogenase